MTIINILKRCFMSIMSTCFKKVRYNRGFVFNLIAIFVAVLLISGAYMMGGTNMVYSSACSDFNNNQSSCQATPGCTYPGNTGACSDFNSAPGTCGGTSGCSQNFFDCSSLSDGGGDGTACNAHSGCSYDDPSGSCSGTPYNGICSGNYDNGFCTGTYDIVAPTLTSFTSTTGDGTYDAGANINITATFNEALAGGSTMTVQLDTGASVTLDTVSGSTLSGTYVVGVGEHSSDLAVSSISSASITDLSSNNSTSYSVPSAPNNISDTSAIILADITPPTLSTADVNGATLTLTYNEALDTGSTPATTDFVVNVNGTSVSVTSVNVVGSTVVLTLEMAVNGNFTTTIDYTPGTNTIRDIATNNAASLSGQAVTNNGDITPPTLSTAEVNGTNLTLTYSEALDTGSTPATTDFVVNVNGTPVSVTSVNVVGSTAVLMLASAVVLNDTVTINYTPGTNQIQDVVGNQAGSLVGESVTNNTNIDCTTITVGAGPRSVSVIGNKAYVINSGNTVSVIDTYTDTVIKTITVGDSPDSSVAVGNKLYIDNYGSGTVSVIDTSTDTVIKTITVGNGPYNPTVVGTYVYVNNSSNSISVIDTITDTVIVTIPIVVGTNPYSSSLVGNKLYVMFANSDTVSVIDTSTNTVIRTISLPGYSQYSYVVGSVVYTLHINGSVSIIDSITDTVLSNIQVGSAPVTSTVVGTKVYVNNSGSNTVSVIDADPTHSGSYNSVIATIPVGSGPQYSFVVGTKLYVNNVTSNDVSIIDTTLNTVIATTSPIGSPFQSSRIGTKLYVTNINSNLVSVIDTRTNNLFNICSPHLTSITSSSANGTYTTGQSLNVTANFNEGLGAGSKMRLTLNSGATVDLTSVSGSTLTGSYTIGGGETSPDLSVSSISNNPTFTSVSDTSSPANTQTSFSLPTSPELTGDTSSNLGDLKNILVNASYTKISVGTNPYQLATVGSIVYVANQGSNSVSVIDTSTNTVIATTTVGSQPYGVAYNSTTKEIYVANLKGNSVSVIDADPASGTYNTVTNTISVGIEPYYVASLGTKIYVTNNLSWTVSVIDTSSHTVTNTINVGVSPRGIKVHGTDLYVANFGSTYGGSAQGTVSVINSLTNLVTATISVGSGARGVAVNGSEVYVSNFNDGTVSVINTGSNTVTNTIAVGSGPRGMLSLGSNIYVENYKDGTISVIATGSHTVTGTYKVGNTPAGMTAVGTDIYVSRFTDGLVDIFDTTNNTLKLVVVLDIAPPVISSTASSTTSTTATITWTTDEAATSTVSFGLTSGYGSASTSASLVTSHSITLTGLSPSTTYHFQVSTADASNNVATSSDLTFTTSAGADVTPPVISSVTASGLTTTGATITWTTDEVSDSLVEYGLTSSYTASSTYSATLATSHSVSISGLVAGTIYHFRVISIDGSGNRSNGTDQTFTTTANTSGGGGGSGGSGGGSGGSTGGGSSGVIKIPPVPVVLPPLTTPPASLPKFFFQQNLNPGAKDSNDIKELQHFLNTHGFPVSNKGPGSLGNESTFFGPATVKALIAFQESKNITPATGLLGPKTRATINAMTEPTVEAPKPPLATSTPPLCDISNYTLTKPVKFGNANNPIDVKLLENFLNTYEGLSLAVNGVYTKADYDAVLKFQTKYASSILTPWGLKQATGYVFTTTLDQIKKIVGQECKK